MILIIIFLLILIWLFMRWCEQSIEVDKTIFEYKIAVCFIVRDGELYLEKNLKQIIQLVTPFKDYRIFYLENDSKDQTVDILKRFKQSNPKIIGDSIHINKDHSTKLCKDTLNVNCSTRTDLLGKLRQQVFTKSLTYDSDLTLMLDMDFIQFDFQDFYKMITKMRQVNGNGIFGMSYSGLLPYDTLAVQPSYKVIPIVLFNDTVSVDSAFSGFGVYDTRYLKNHNVSYIQNGECEHIAFNKQISNLYVDPTFRPLF